MLTPRETEVICLMIKGLTNPEISEFLSISEHTTKAHLTSIYQKLNVKNRVQAIVKLLKKDTEKSKITLMNNYATPAYTNINLQYKLTNNNK